MVGTFLASLGFDKLGTLDSCDERFALIIGQLPCSSDLRERIYIESKEGLWVLRTATSTLAFKSSSTRGNQSTALNDAVDLLFLEFFKLFLGWSASCSADGGFTPLNALAVTERSRLGDYFFLPLSVSLFRVYED